MDPNEPRDPDEPAPFPTGEHSPFPPRGEELAPEGVRVTIVSPGYVRTPIFDGVADDDLRAEYQRRLASVGLDPEAVAAQIVHALSQPAGVDLLEVAVLSTRQ